MTRHSLWIWLAVCLTVSAGAENYFVEEDEVTWKVNQFSITRWKTLVGGNEGGHIPQADIQFGLWELAPHAIYQGHRHAAPEVYHLTRGRVRWTVNGQSKDLGPGSTIYTPSNSVHRMENLGATPAQAIWLWWAPGGDRDVFNAPYEFTEPAPQQHPDASFSNGSAERLYP